jgi:hypothetical protein
MSEHQARLDFYETFDRNHCPENGNQVPFAEFVSYYTCVSAVIESDSFFNQLLMNTWNLSTQAAGNSGVRRPLSAYNTRPKNFGGVTQQSGKESHPDT